MTQSSPPSEDVVLYSGGDIFPDCEAIPIVWDTLVIALPKTSEEDFKIRLGALPSDLGGVPKTLAYHNGPLPTAKDWSFGYA